MRINDFDYTSAKFCTAIVFSSFFKREISLVKDFTRWHGGNYGCYYGVIHCYVPTRWESPNTHYYKLYSFKLSHNAGYQLFSEFEKDITDILVNNKYKVIEFKTQKEIK